MTTPEHSIAALCQRSRDISLEKGWLNPDGSDPRPYYKVVALFHSELSEALEDARAKRSPGEIYYEVKFKEEDGSTSKENVSAGDIDAARKIQGKYGRGREFLDAKPCGIPIELADFIIRVAQYQGSLGQGVLFQKTVVTAGLLAWELKKSSDLELLIANLHTDVSFSYIAFRGVPALASDIPQNASDYLASAWLSTFVFCENNSIDLWAAIDEKEAYNRTRPVMHGGKAY